MEGPALKSSIQYNSEHQFPLENIPFGAFYSGEGEINCCTRIGDYVIDLAVIERAGLFNGPLFGKLDRKDIFSQKTLNVFIALGKPYWTEARETIQKLFTEGYELNEDVRKQGLNPV